MDEPADNLDRKIFDVIVFAVDCIILQDCDDFVVGLVVVQKPEPSNRFCSYQNVSVGDIFLGEYAYIERVAVSFHIQTCQSLVGEFSHFHIAPGAGNEPVK